MSPAPETLSVPTPDLKRQLRWTWAALGLLAVLVVSVLLARATGVEKWTEVADLVIKVAGVFAVLYVYARHQRAKHDLDRQHVAQQIEHQKAKHALDLKLIDLQGQAAVDRGQLALNVKLTTFLTPHAGGYILRALVEVKNASSKPFRVPVVYVTGRGVPARVDPLKIGWDDFARLPALRTQNAADFGTVMAMLAPEETEQFTAWFFIDADTIASHPTVAIRADVVGAEEKPGALGDRSYQQRFVEWMNERGAHAYPVFRSWPAGARAAAEQAGVALPTKRCLALPPAVPGGDPQGVDIPATSAWGGFLDDTMMWDRYELVPLGRPTGHDPTAT